MSKQKKHRDEDDAASADHGMPTDRDAAELREQVKKLTELAARAQAELQNAKIRMEKEASEHRKFASMSLLIKLLPTIDNLQRAFAHLPEDLQNHDWVKGVSSIEKELLTILEREGLKKIDALGANIDPQRHEVLMEGPGEKGTVVEVFEDGYELHGKVLRPAKVKGGNGTVSE